jgi:hypothetical protein
MGLVTGLMHVFMERACFRLARPTGEYFGLKGCPEPRLTDKPRAAASIVTAGLIPEQLRQYCDLGTQWLKENVPMLINGEFVIDQYAAAYFPRELKDDEWRRAFFLRELTDSQNQEAFELGKTLAPRISEGTIRHFEAVVMENIEQYENSV